MAGTEKDLMRILIKSYSQEGGHWMSNLLKDVGVLSLMPSYTVSELREACRGASKASTAAKFGKSIQDSLERITTHLERHGIEFSGAAEARHIQNVFVDVLMTPGDIQ